MCRITCRRVLSSSTINCNLVVVKPSLIDLEAEKPTGRNLTKCQNRERLNEMARKRRTPEEIKEYQRQWRECNREKVRVYAKRYRDAHRDKPAHLERKYGITVADKQAMWEYQKGLCAVCGEPMKHVFDRNCQVDHCHDTNKVRGLLHWYCNIMVGVVENRPGLLSKVHEYILLHS